MKLFERLEELIIDWKYLIQRDGLNAALPTVVQEISLLPYRHLIFSIVSRSLTEPFPDLQPKIPLEIRPFQPADVGFVREMDRPSEANQCAQRLARGHSGLIALHQGRPAGYAWGYTEEYAQMDKVPLKLEPGDVLCSDVFTHPSFRGQGVQTALSLTRFKMFKDLGLRRAICFIENRNGPSLAVWQRKLGGQVIGHFDFVRVGNWYRVRRYGFEDMNRPVDLEIGLK
jgi:GNAT superfamily N-acetyltransferase